MLVFNLFLNFCQNAWPTLLVLLWSIVWRIAFCFKLCICQKLNVSAKHNICTTTCHVCSNSHSTLTTCNSNNSCFLSVLLSIQHLMRNTSNIQKRRNDFGRFNRCSTKQNRLTLCMTLSYVSNNRSKLFLLSAEDQIILIHTNNWTVRRNWKNTKLVCSHKFCCFRFCSTSHASKLVVHAEVIL
ncbi:Uncharacterised protein [Chlamydia trachomatis]|nr:Uncharacterised protein [Chlamydia trachomatis]